MNKEKKFFLKDQICPECGSIFLIKDSSTGEISCQECGYVIVEKGVDRGPEWRNFKEEGEKRSRVGAPLSIMYHDHGLSTVIEKIHKDASGKNLPKEARESLLRLRKLDVTSQVNPSETRNLQQAINILEIYADKLYLSTSVVEKAMQIYRKAFKNGLVRGRSIRAIIAASIYTACRMSYTPRDLREFEKAYPIVKKKAIAQSYRLLVKHLNLKIPVIDPTIYVNKIASKLGLGQNIIQETMKILNKAEEIGATIGKDPVGIAAAALYMACQNLHPEITQKDIAKVAGVTEVTVRNRFKDLKDTLNFHNILIK
ncbi:MAG: TFIIB-type zinc ribbon-containing protein [Nitrososphaerota archaeon]